MTKLGRALGHGRLFLEKRGDGEARWTLDWKDGQGCRRRQALSTDKRVSERMRAELIARRDLELAGLGAVEGQSRSLLEVKDLYLADLAHRAGAGHLVSVQYRIAIVLRALRGRRVRDVQVTELLNLRARLLKEGKSHRTANVTIGGLKAMLNWAVSAGLIAENPIARLKPLPYREQHVRHARRALSDKEIDDFLAAAAADDREQAAFYAAETTINNGTKGALYAEKRRLPRVPQALLWRTLIETGARWSELTSTTWNDLDVAKQTLRLRATTTKSGRTRTVPLRAALVADLIALRAIHQRSRERLAQPGDRVFITPDGADWPRDTSGARRIFHRCLDNAGIAKRDSAGAVVDIHALRHTAASRMARHGVPLVITQRVLGHSDPALTARAYTHLDVDDLRQAVVEPGKSHSASA